MARYRRTVLCLIVVLSVLLGFGCGQYRQIVLGNAVTCNMSTVYANRKDGTSLDCTGAINGNTDTYWYNTEADNPNCVFTDYKEWPSYWFLNLGQSRAIHRITIYYVQYDDGSPYNYDYTDYMMNISVSVDGSEIFRYPDVASNITNPTQITDNLPTTGQIIKVERTTKWRRNYVPICEVQVWVCKKDRYGQECANNCSANCQENGGETTCDMILGICIRDCKAGYWGDQCDKTCNRGCVDGTCNRDDGQCQCAPGWREPSCDVCDDSHYGQDCSRDCGRCTGGVPCHNITGLCQTCQPGYIPPLCQNSCPVRKYGQNCALSCGHCADNVTCHHVDGHCPDGCGSGYLGELCDTVPEVEDIMTTDVSANVTWTMRREMGGTCYLEYRESGSSLWERSTEGAINIAWLQLDALEPATEYEVRILCLRDDADPDVSQDFQSSTVKRFHTQSARFTARTTLQTLHIIAIVLGGATASIVAVSAARARS